MSAITTDAAVHRPAASRPTARLVRRLLRQHAVIVAWMWPISVVGCAVAVLVISRFTTITASAWEYAGEWPRWYLFATAIALTVAWLPLAVANGVTRRVVLRSLGVAGLVAAAAWALFMTAGHLVERALYDAAGWQWALTGPHLGGGYRAPAMLVEFGLVLAVYLEAGALVAGVYYRAGAWWGTALLPLTLLPVVAIEVLLSTGWVGATMAEALDGPRPAAPLLTVGGTAVAALTAVAVHRVLRDVPIHPKKG